MAKKDELKQENQAKPAEKAEEKKIDKSKGKEASKEAQAPVEQIPRQINLLDVVKQSMVQVKYEEIGSWLATHRTPLFYAHKAGFSVIDEKFIESRPWLKKALKKMVDEVTKEKKPKPTAHAPSLPFAPPREPTERAGYIG